MTNPEMIDRKKNARVAVVKQSRSAYEGRLSLDRLADLAGWLGTRGPLGNVIPEGARVLIKPNLVLHRNHGPEGIEPLITHPSLIRAATDAALRAGASEVLVGDAPLQSCNFEELLRSTGLDEWAAALQKDERFRGIRDFRRTTCSFRNGVRDARENLQSEDNFVIFDLAHKSLLEPVSSSGRSFRVTSYNPDLMAATHHRGRHKYLVARDVIDADVVINLPKLKTHKKAGVTCALKNLIGINGNKEFLPHHRIGGSLDGGDCYPGRSQVKRALEYALDKRNGSPGYAGAKLWGNVADSLDKLSRAVGDNLGVEGSWSGNDTIWRTCLDLNRILLYGRPDGSMSDEPQRRVIHIADAIIAGQGDGPLSPQPFELGVLLGGLDPAALDSVGAALLGYEPSRIPLVRESFGRFEWPITHSSPEDVSVICHPDDRNVESQLGDGVSRGIAYPEGWRDAASAMKCCIPCSTSD